jgi:KipI family sensor histidine kinase inhibitor
MEYEQPKFRDMGDRSLVVELGDEISQDVNRRVRMLYFSLRDRNLNGIVDLIPSYAALLVVFDPLGISLAALRTAITGLMETADPARIPEPKTVKIPVVYGGSYGPDLVWLAGFCQITAEEVIRLHTATTYHVFMIGFTPGFPYMGEVPAQIAAPRRQTPRTLVPQGSVGIAQRQTGIYPVASPGGWQIIGRTPLRLFDPLATPPAPLTTGDAVTFYPIDGEAFESWGS